VQDVVVLYQRVGLRKLVLFIVAIVAQIKHVPINSISNMHSLFLKYNSVREKMKELVLGQEDTVDSVMLP
jgi:hypothetical protein